MRLVTFPDGTCRSVPDAQDLIRQQEAINRLKGDVKMNQNNQSDKMDKTLILKCMRDSIETNSKKIVELHEEIEKLEKENKRIKSEIDKVTHE